MKKIIIILTLFFYISSTPASAFVPVAIPPALYLVSTLLHAAAAAGIYYKLRHNTAAVVDPLSGKVIHPSDVTWIEAGDIPTLKNRDNNANLPYEEIKRNVDQNPNDYPATKNAIYQPEYFPLTKDSTVGGNFINPFNGKNNKIISITYKSNAAYCQGQGYAAPVENPGSSTYFDKYFQNGTCAGGTGTNWARISGYFDPTVQPPNQTTYTRAQFASNISNSDGTLKSAYESEIDKMINDPNYVPVFTDATTGLPDAPPTNAMTPSQVEAYNTAGATREAAEQARQAAATSAGNAATAANNAATAATNAYIGSGGNPSTGQGGDPGLYQKMLDAQAAAAAAQAAADKAQADIATQDADKVLVSPPAYDAYGDGTEHKFGDRFSQFIDSMKQSSLFSLPSTVIGSVPSGGQSQFNLSFGRFGNTVFDLASYGNAINIIKTLVLIVFSVVSFKIVTLKGGS